MKTHISLIDSDRTIFEFSRKVGNRFEHLPLSNFYPSPIAAPRGQVAPTVEHYYQAAKTTDAASQDEILAAPTPGAAKKLGRKVTLRDDWEEIKVPVMRRALAKKFPDHGDPLGRWLVNTYPFALVEGNTWGDTFWGKCKIPDYELEGNWWQGQNWLGTLLMVRRGELLGEAGAHVPSFEDLLASAPNLMSNLFSSHQGEPS